MKVYLAGIDSRLFVLPPLAGENYKSQAMKVYLAGENYKSQAMKVYLAGEHSIKNGKHIQHNGIYILESFIYCRNNKHFPLIKKCSKDLLLDSGAFTFMASKSKGKKIDWDEYVAEYAAFINAHDIDLFFELDIDSVVGIKEVERLRSKIERLTGKKTIPVWHKSRGLDYWIKMCKEYSYVAIGGIVTNEIKKNEYNIFTKLLKIASDYDCKVHGLGFTNEKGLKRYKFYSVDSTAWVYGNRSGFLYRFNGETLDKIYKPKGTRLKSKEAATHNFKEWIKFQKYAIHNL